MPKNVNIQAKYINKNTEVGVDIVLFCFKEGDVELVYSPYLEISGYGKNEEEAMDSFNINLEAFLEYTTNKKTLVKELTRLGWDVVKGNSKKPKKISAPTWENIINKNETISHLLNNTNVRTSRRELKLPV